MKGYEKHKIVSKVLGIVIALSMVLPAGAMLSEPVRGENFSGDNIAGSGFIVYGSIKDNVGMLVSAGTISAINLNNGEYVNEFILDGAYLIDLADVNATIGDDIFLSAQNGICISNQTFKIENSVARMDFVLDPDAPAIPSASPPNLGDFDFRKDSEPWMIPPPSPPVPPVDGEWNVSAEPAEALVIEPSKPSVSLDEEFFPEMPYAPGEKPRVVYNITLGDIHRPDGALYLGKRAPLQFEFENAGSAITKVNVEISVLQPDGSEKALGNFDYTIPPGKTQKKTLTWCPEQGGEHTIILKVSYVENGVSTEYTREVGIYVLHGTLDWGGGKTIPNPMDGDTLILPPDSYNGPVPYEIYLYDGDLTILPGGTLIFKENPNGYNAKLIINGEGPSFEPGYWGIDIQKDATSQGVFEIHDGSEIYALSTTTGRYQFDVYGALTIDSGSAVKWMHGDATHSSNPGGIRLYDGATCTIADGAKVTRGLTHNIFVEGADTQLMISDSYIEDAGAYGFGHGIYVTNGASPTIEYNTIANNEDCGIFIDTPCEKKIFNNTFTSNYIGINCLDSSPVIENNTILDNFFGINLDYNPAVTTFDIPVIMDWNLISVSLAPTNTDILTVLNDAAGDGATTWDRALWYDPRDPSDPWKSYNKASGGTQDLLNVDHTMGLWLHVTALGDGYLTVSGRLETALIDMYPGWNMIGYPAFDDSTYNVGNLKTDTGATIVEGFDETAEYQTRVLEDAYVLKRGEGYWVHLENPVTWTVNPDRSSPLIQNNTISDGHFQGIVCYYGSSPKIYNNTIERNTFGIDLLGSASSLIVKNNTVEYNRYGMWFYDANPTLRYNNISFNEDRGLWLQKHSHPTIENNIVGYNGLKTQFFDDIESGTGEWLSDGLWHIVDDDTSPYPNSHSPTHSWWFGDDGTGLYESYGFLYMETLDLSDAQKATLTFQGWYETESTDTEKDQRWIYAWNVTDPDDYIEAQVYGEEMGKWTEHAIDISHFAGAPLVAMGFYFDAIDGSDNDHRGWYVDDIRVTYSNISIEGYGIFCEDASSPTIRYNSVALNNIGVACYEKSNPTILRNNITSSMNVGIYVNDSSPLIQLNKISSETEICYSDPPGSDSGFSAMSPKTAYPTTISLNSYQFDPLRGEPALSDTLKIDSYPDGINGIYIVQFKGPIQNAWLSEIVALGAEVYSYLPNYAYLVGMENDVADAVSTLTDVRWVGIYQPAYKMDSRLLSCDGTKANVTVLVANDEGLVTTLNAMSPMINAVYTAWNFRFYTGMVINIDIEDISQLLAMPNTYWIESYVPRTLMGEVAAEITGGYWSSGTPWNGPGSYVNSLGYDGSGVIVSVVDTGIDDGNPATMHPDLADRVGTFIDYTETDDTDGTGEDNYGHGTHCAGTIAANGALGTLDGDLYLYGMGVAPAAGLVNQRIFNDGGYWAGPEDHVLTQDAINNGAVVGSNSWGAYNDGTYDVYCSEYDYLVRDANRDLDGDQPYILVFAAGNSGWSNGYVRYSTIDSPGAAKNVITVGASLNYRPDIPSVGSWPADNIDAMVGFSSRGPCADGRIKPDIVAPGTWVASLQSSSAPLGGLWGSIDQNYQWCGGTSMSTPAVAGGAALFVQYYQSISGGATPSPALTKAALINGATNMAEVAQLTYGSQSTSSVPNNDEGWGRMNLVGTLQHQSDVLYSDQEYIFTNSGESREYSVFVGDTSKPFKASLAWTDAAAAPNANPALVNDLDLIVIDPNGYAYYGNQFTNGWSDRSKTDSDRINNVECVYINQEEVTAGEYTIWIIATNIAGDGLPGDPGLLDQDFALVATYGEVSSKGTVQFDRTSYKSTATAKITLADADLTSQGSVAIYMTSNPELDIETALLTETPADSGIFVGTIAIVLAPSGAKHWGNGVLEVIVGDTIEARYEDDDDGTGNSATTTDTATIDDTSPTISNVKATILPGNKVRITWDTNENADGRVFYDTVIPPRWENKDIRYSREHSILLAGLTNGATYQFAVQSADAAGNIVLDDNGGNYYLFTIFGYTEGTGIWVTDWATPSDTQPIIEDNNISDNYRGIMVFGDSNPTIERNEINRSVWSGIWSVWSASEGWPSLKIKGNNISESGWSGIYLYGASAKIENNRLENNTRQGIYINYGRSEVTEIMNNTILWNGYDANVRVRFSGIMSLVAPIMVNNTASYNAAAGITYYSAAWIPDTVDPLKFRISRNNLSYNRYGLYSFGVPSGGPGPIDDTLTGAGPIASKSSEEIGYGAAYDNNISYNYEGVVCIYQSYNPPLFRNNINNNTRCGIYADCGGAWFENNTIRDNEYGVLGWGYGLDYNAYLVGKNNSINNNSIGITNGYRCTGALYCNEIVDNYVGFWSPWVGQSGVYYNDISRSELVNVYMTGGSGTNMIYNNITDSYYGIYLHSQSASTISNNNISRHLITGVYIDYNTGIYGEFTFAQNNVSDNNEGIRINYSMPSIWENAIENNTYGIISTNSSATIIRNKMHTNDVGLYCFQNYYTEWYNPISQPNNERYYGTVTSTQSVAQSFIPTFNKTYQINTYAVNNGANEGSRITIHLRGSPDSEDIAVSMPVEPYGDWVHAGFYPPAELKPFKEYYMVITTDATSGGYDMYGSPTDMDYYTNGTAYSIQDNVISELGGDLMFTLMGHGSYGEIADNSVKFNKYITYYKGPGGYIYGRLEGWGMYLDNSFQVVEGNNITANGYGLTVNDGAVLAINNTVMGHIYSTPWGTAPHPDVISSVGIGAMVGNGCFLQGVNNTFITNSRNLLLTDQESKLKWTNITSSYVPDPSYLPVYVGVGMSNSAVDMRNAIIVAGANDAISVNDCFDTRIFNAEITYNHYGIAITGSEMTIENCEITYNNRGISCEGPSTLPSQKVTVAGCEISFNEEIGVSISQSVVDILDNHITMNAQGIVYRDNNAGSIQGNYISEHQALNDEGYGIYIYNADIAVSENDISFNDCGIYINGSAPEIWNNNIDGNYYGVWCEYYSDPLVFQNNLTNNDFGVYSMTYSTPYIRSNNIVGNAQYGVYNADLTTSSIYAKYNWWGDALGPYHPLDNPLSTGDRISDGVLWDPPEPDWIEWW
jgi:parallel beta-helix repeat protein